MTPGSTSDAYKGSKSAAWEKARQLFRDLPDLPETAERQRAGRDEAWDGFQWAVYRMLAAGYTRDEILDAVESACDDAEES